MTESVAALKEVESGLDAFLTETDPMLEEQTGPVGASGSGKRSSPIPPPPPASAPAGKISSRQRQSSGTDRPHRYAPIVALQFLIEYVHIEKQFRAKKYP